MASSVESQVGEWDKLEPIIRRLYFEQEKSLADVMRFMEENHGFKATQKVYKYQLKKTGLSKNIKRSEALAMARVKAWRDARGKTSEFWRYGKPIEEAKLHKFVRLYAKEFRAMVIEDQHRVEPIEALLPPHVVVLSPSRPSARVSARLEGAEKMFMGLRDYMMTAGPPAISVPSRSSPFSSDLRGNGQNITDLHLLWQQMETNMHLGIQTLRNHPAQGGRLLESAFSLVHPLVSKADPWTLVPLLWRFSPLHETESWANRAPEVTRVLVDYIGQASVLILGPDHPYTAIFQGFGESIYQTDHQKSLEAMSVFWKVVCDVLEARGRLNTLEYTLAYTWHFNAVACLAEPDPAKQISKFEAAWRSHTERLRACDQDRQTSLQSFLLSLEVVRMVASQGKITEAHSLLEVSLKTLDADAEAPLRWLGYARLADSYEKAGEAVKAREAREKAGEAARAVSSQSRTHVAKSPERFMLEVFIARSAPKDVLSVLSPTDVLIELPGTCEASEASER